MKYEHKIATGKTLDELSNSMTEIANIRDNEINEEIAKGYDVMDYVDYWFKPVGELSHTNGVYTQVMRRRK